MFIRPWLLCVNLCVFLCLSWLLFTTPVSASISDDTYEGNVFILYAGNGSLVPPRLTLAQSFERHLPTILVFYVDDSSDCKQYAFIINQLQKYYGKQASLIPVAVDTIPRKSHFTPSDPGYYYEGVVPQTVILDQEQKVVFNGKGQVKFEQADDVLRQVFNLVPRAESVELKRREFNEFNAELAP